MKKIKIKKVNFGCDVSVCPSVQTLGEGEGEGSFKATRRRRRMPSFLGGKSRGAFGKLAFFLARNCMTIVAFEKQVFFKA